MQSWNRTSHFKSHLLLIWNFQMRLEMRCAIWNFCNLKLLNLSQELLIWNFQMKLETRCAVWNFLSFSTYHRGCLFQTFRWDLKGDMLFETWNCLTMSWELLIWKFQMRLMKRCDIQNLWNFWNLKFFKPIKGVAYLKLLDENWNKMCYLKLFETFETWNFDVSFKNKKFQLTLNLEVINLLVHRVDILLLSELMFAFSNH